jgi:hypothetical protein
MRASNRHSYSYQTDDNRRLTLAIPRGQGMNRIKRSSWQSVQRLTISLTWNKQNPTHVYCRSPPIYYKLDLCNFRVYFIFSVLLFVLHRTPDRRHLPAIFSESSRRHSSTPMTSTSQQFSPR